MLGRSGFQDYMNLFGEVDIVLDTTPFGGGTTTCHSLWMGVPVVALVGDRHASRMGLSIATATGMTDWVADNPEQYVERALAKASDTSELAELRASMRDRLRASPLLDVKRFTKHLEDAYRRCWMKWCQR